ncbi:unnamed protein product [Paramecium octaurelia]|uniref:Uncharacterized protein n=1 Tax=Paramecium octaurelia TaxID=43137 RepID=A0A8S1XI74_PAROT|nr:unnamed protein product [Paramecium octaurelia]
MDNKENIEHKNQHEMPKIQYFSYFRGKLMFKDEYKLVIIYYRYDKGIIPPCDFCGRYS